MVDRCILCGGPTLVDCPTCVERYARRHATTRSDIRHGLETLARGASDLRDATVYQGPDGLRRRIRELLPAPAESLAARDAAAFTDLLIRFGAQHGGPAVLAVEFHGRDHVAVQLDVLAKELTVLAEMVDLPSAHYAIPVHLRQVLVASALIWHATNPDTDSPHRLGVGLARTIESLNFRSAEESAWSQGDAPEAVETIAEVTESLVSFAEFAGLTRSRRGRAALDDIPASESALVDQAFSGALTRAHYTLLSSAAHGQHRHGFALVDEIADLRRSRATDPGAQDLLAVALNEGMDALIASAVAIRAFADYTASAQGGSAVALYLRALMHLRYVCQREVALGDERAASGAPGKQPASGHGHEES